MTSIKVAVRCRPLFENERPASGLDIQGRRILLDSKTYDPDYTFTSTATQMELYSVCKPIVQSVKDGCNGTVMVYGQTGTGKTYTMLGDDEARDNISSNNKNKRNSNEEEINENVSSIATTASNNNNNNNTGTNRSVNITHEKSGLVHFIIADMLDHVQQRITDGVSCALTLSMIEIYNEKMTDMLSINGEAEVTLINGFPRFTTKITLCSLDDAMTCVSNGLAWRHTASTLMNERSSRSHVVFILDLEEMNPFTEQAEVAHLFMVDLAGSESLKKSQASGSVASETGKINRSLLALKSVLLALSNTNEATRPGHVPYRDSRLTELLQDSIGGTARTLMIACISSNGRDIEETKSTLLYAVKARSIRNASNTEKEKLLIRLRSMEVENQKLRNRLQERVNEKGGYYISKEEHEGNERQNEENVELKTNIEQLLQQHRNSQAREHISESQTKVLQLMIKSKQGEIDEMKRRYYEAICKFDSNAKELERVVESTVCHAHHIAQHESLQQSQTLHDWKESMLRVAEADVADASDILRSLEEMMHKTTYIKSLENEEEEKEEDKKKEQEEYPSWPHTEQKVEQKDHNKKNNIKETESTANTFFMDADRTIARTVYRIHKSFVQLAHEFKLVHDQHCTQIKEIEEHRREAMERVCEEMKSTLSTSLEKLTKYEETASIDINDALGSASAKVTQIQQQMQEGEKQHEYVEAKWTSNENYTHDIRCTWMLPLQQITRNVCISTIRSVEPLFPSPLQSSAAEPVHRALSSIPIKYRRKLATLSVNNLPLMNSVPPVVEEMEYACNMRNLNNSKNLINNNNIDNKYKYCTSKTASPTLSPMLRTISASKTNVMLNYNNDDIASTVSVNSKGDHNIITSIEGQINYSDNFDSDDNNENDYNVTENTETEYSNNDDNTDINNNSNSNTSNETEIDSIVEKEETTSVDCAKSKNNNKYTKLHDTANGKVGRKMSNMSAVERSSSFKEQSKRFHVTSHSNVNTNSGPSNNNSNSTRLQQYNVDGKKPNHCRENKQRPHINKHVNKNAKQLRYAMPKEINNMPLSNRTSVMDSKRPSNNNSSVTNNNYNTADVTIHANSNNMLENDKSKETHHRELFPPPSSRSTLVRSQMPLHTARTRTTTLQTSSALSLQNKRTSSIVKSDNTNKKTLLATMHKCVNDNSYKRSRSTTNSSLTTSPRCKSNASLSNSSPPRSARKPERSKGTTTNNKNNNSNNIADCSNGSNVKQAHHISPAKAREDVIATTSTTEAGEDEDVSTRQISPSRRLSEFTQLEYQSPHEQN